MFLCPVGRREASASDSDSETAKQNTSILPSDLLLVILELVPSATLRLLQSNDAFYRELVLGSPRIWRHFALNLYADVDRIRRNNRLVEMASISIPGTAWSLHFQQHKTGQNIRNDGYEHQIMEYYRHNDERISLNLYMSIPTTNAMISEWMSTGSLAPLLIPMELLKKIRIGCYMRAIMHTLNFLACHLSSQGDVAQHTRISMDMDCLMHSQLSTNQGLHPLHSVTSLIIDNADLTRQFSAEQTRPFSALPNVECLTLCCSYISFYSSTLTTIHSMLFSSKYRPFYSLWQGFVKLKSIVISEFYGFGHPNCNGADVRASRLYSDLRNSRKLIRFPRNIRNLWFPHSPWFDLRRIARLDVLCLDPVDIILDDDGCCMMEELKMSANLLIRHLMLNIASVSAVQPNAYVHANEESTEPEQEQVMISFAELVARAQRVTVYMMPSESVRRMLLRHVHPDQLAQVGLEFVDDAKKFRHMVHRTMQLGADVADNDYEYMIHNRTAAQHHEQICHLDIIDDILGSITYVHQ